MSGYILMVVDGGMWSDPAIYGPFTTEGQARTEAQMRIPGARPRRDDDAFDFAYWQDESGEHVGLILGLGSPVQQMRARVLQNDEPVPDGAVLLYEKEWNEESSKEDHISAIQYFGSDPLNCGSVPATIAVTEMLAEPGTLAAMDGEGWYVILEAAE